ncbi:MAG: hypothetical protein PHO87_05355, partial [Acholeplasmataceae bacterium]|nr:hypothetical protein [Acholeplasmataceae bacterium]
AVYVSDRRWQKIAIILKTAAYLCDRTEVIPVDALILRHCLWTLEENRTSIDEIILTCVKEFGCANNAELQRWILNYKDIEKEVTNTFFYPEDIYETENIARERCFPVTKPNVLKNCGYNYNNNTNKNTITIRFYIPIKYMNTTNSFSPIDEGGNSITKVKCNFNGKKSCEVQINKYVLDRGWDSDYLDNSFVKWFDVVPRIQIKKGAQKHVDSRVKDTYINACNNSLISLERLITDTKSYVSAQEKINNTPFVPAEKRDLVLDVFNSFIKDLENHKLNAEHLLEKVESHAVSKY